jgi:antitoxin ParD1/3/4
LENLVYQKAGTGRYNNASEVIREVLRLMEERDEMQALHKASMREQIAAGMASLRAGTGSDGEDFMASIDQGLEKGVRVIFCPIEAWLINDSDPFSPAPEQPAAGVL